MGRVATPVSRRTKRGRVRANAQTGARPTTQAGTRVRANARTGARPTTQAVTRVRASTWEDARATTQAATRVRAGTRARPHELLLRAPLFAAMPKRVVDELAARTTCRRLRK